jgi:ribosomal protein L11 methyltransferase
MNYLELNIRIEPREPWSEIVVAQLADLGFESFVDTEKGVSAYGPVDNIDMDLVIQDSILSGNDLDYTIKFDQRIIPYQNWNAIWESDFEPVEVEDYLTILAPFHEKENRKGMTIQIKPQMSFGTGHHQTTWLMSKALFELDSIPENVLDMGTGTGVLAILAEKLGAKSILAIDIEEWSAINAKENCLLNECSHIDTVCGDIDLIEGKTFGLIIANINKNVLKAQIPHYSSSLENGGVLILSGFFDTDVKELLDFAADYNLGENKIFSKETWGGIQLIKHS